MGERRHAADGPQGSARGLALQFLCIASLIAAARAGVDSQGQDWGVLTKTRAELGLPPAKPAHECMPLDVHCAICADNICQGCSFPFQVNQWGKCECQEGHEPSDDGSTCVDSIAVLLGRGIYNNPLVQDASNHTKAALDNAGKEAQVSAVKANKNVASFVSKQLGVKLPTVPDPLQSFLAAVGAPTALPEPDTPAPEQAPGAAVSGAPSMPNAPASAPDLQLPGGVPDPFVAGRSLFPDIFATAPAAPVAVKAPKAPAPTKSMQQKPAGTASKSLLPDIFGATSQPGSTSFLSELFAPAPVAAASAQAPAAHAPTTGPEQQPAAQAQLPPITSLLDQGNALLPSWLPKWGGRRLLREHMQL